MLPEVGVRGLKGLPARSQRSRRQRIGQQPRQIFTARSSLWSRA